jgi:microcystin-dependent protein
MALETASYLNQLVPANPLSTDSVAQADDHLRLIKQVLVNTFPNVGQPVTATAAALSKVTETNLVPTGLISMWSGTVANIPSGWALCDGTNGTPNLGDKFILGYKSGTNTIGSTGGSYTSGAGGAHTHGMDTQGAHTHGGTTGSTTLTVDQIPSHTHSLSAAAGAGGNYASGGSGYGYPTSGTTGATGGGQGHTHTVSSDGSHAHNVVAATDHTHSITPPYYVLAFIIKT